MNITLGLYGSEKVRYEFEGFAMDDMTTRRGKKEIIKTVFPIWTAPPGEFENNQLNPQ